MGRSASIGILGCAYLFFSLPNQTQLCFLMRTRVIGLVILSRSTRPRGGADAQRRACLKPRRNGTTAPDRGSVAVLLIPAVLGSSQTIFNDGDVSWHIATGQWILDHRAIPHTDPFSFTWAGKPWVPIEWLAEVI